MQIPAGRMKTKKDHLVMLPTQAIEMLRELQRLGGGRVRGY
jgi:integrase